MLHSEEMEVNCPVWLSGPIAASYGVVFPPCSWTEGKICSFHLVLAAAS